ncbi:hypothetical protein AAMO2058_000032300 [Amorphochlora amoebiformis]
MALSRENCPSIMDPCDSSDNCYSFRAVKKLHFISPDNLKGREEFENFPKMRHQMRSKHLRIRAARNWFNIAGFFTYPMYVINQILYAEKLGLIGDKPPFVYMPESHHYFDSCVDGGTPGEEFYTQWFEPISDVKFNEVKEDDVWEFSQLTIESLHHHKDVVHSYPYKLHGERLKTDTGTQNWINCMRERTYDVFKKYIDVKPSVLKETTDMFESNFGSKPVIGIHMRGTDKWINSKVEPLKYVDEIEIFIEKNPDGKIFLATDDPKFLVATKEKFPDLVAMDAMRQTGNVFFDDKVDKDRKTKDVLVDSLMLSFCSTLIKSWSSVSEFSVYFRMKHRKNKNPMTVVDLQLTEQGQKLQETEMCATERTMQYILNRPQKHMGKQQNIWSGRKNEHYSLDTEAKLKANVDLDKGEMDTKTGCRIATPRIRSMTELQSILKTRACSRTCTAFRSLRQGGNPHANMTGSKTIVVVVGHYQGQLQWTELQPVCYVVMDTREKKRMAFLNTTDKKSVSSNKGNVSSSFLRFFVQAYHFLPDNVITAHGDRLIQYSGDLVNTLRHINPDSYGYASLNAIYFHMIDLDDYCGLKGFYDTFITNKNIYPPFPRDFMGVSLSCCGEFLVSKERILARPLIEYQKLYNFSSGSLDWGEHSPTDIESEPNLPVLVQNKTTPLPDRCPKKRPHEMDNFGRGKAIELFWPVLFGEPWSEPREDPKQLCGSNSTVCPQDWPNIQNPEMRVISAVIPSGVDNPMGAFWGPALKWQEETTNQESHLLGQNFLITTPTSLSKLAGAEEEIIISPNTANNNKNHRAIKGYDDHTNDVMGDERIMWMANHMANRTINEPEYINILLYNDDPCGIDFYGLRVEPFLKFDGCGTPVRLYSSRHRSLIQNMDIVIVSRVRSEQREDFNTPNTHLKKKGQLWMSCSIDNGETYERIPNTELKKRFKIDKIISPSVHADMYVSFYSQFYVGAESIRTQLRGIKPLPYSQKFKKIAIMDAACFGSEFTYRNSYIEQLFRSKKLEGKIASMGPCWHNEEPRLPWVDGGVGNRSMAFYIKKLANIRPYMFTLCHESVDMDEWVTEKVFHALSVGSIPIYRGSKSIKAFVPCEHCVIDTRDFKTINDLATHINEIINNRELFHSYHTWRSEPYEYANIHPNLNPQD